MICSPDEIIMLYSNAQYDKLQILLEENIQRFLEEANEPQLARVLSYCGIINLFLSRYHFVSTITKQIEDEYQRTPIDVRVRAFYARYLAMHCAFSGNAEESERFFAESLMCFEEMDWHFDEAIVILEYVYWHGFLGENSSYIRKARERLKALNALLQNQLKDELTVIDMCLSGQYHEPPPMTTTYSRLFLFLFQFLHALAEKEPRTLLQISHSWQHFCDHTPLAPSILVDMLQGLAAISEHYPEKKGQGIAPVAEAYTAKLELYRHPWFSQTLRKIAELSTQLAMESETPNEPIRLSVTLFQSFSLRAGERSVEGDSWGTKQERELFLYILLQPQWKVAKEVILELFFEGEDLKKSSNRLYVTIHRINRSLQKSFQIFHPIPIVQIQQGSVVINPDYIEDIDVHSYQKLLSVSNQLWSHNRAAAVELLHKARSLYTVHLLPHLLYLDWLNQFREQLQYQHGKTLQRLARYYAEHEEHAYYEEVMLELVELHPLDEEMHAEFIQYLLRSNRQAEAHQWYKRLERLLQEELGVRPSAEVTNLVKAYRKFGGNL